MLIVFDWNKSRRKLLIDDSSWFAASGIEKKRYRRRVFHSGTSSSKRVFSDYTYKEIVRKMSGLIGLHDIMG